MPGEEHEKKEDEGVNDGLRDVGRVGDEGGNDCTGEGGLMLAGGDVRALCVFAEEVESVLEPEVVDNGLAGEAGECRHAEDDRELVEEEGGAPAPGGVEVVGLRAEDEADDGEDEGEGDAEGDGPEKVGVRGIEAAIGGESLVLLVRKDGEIGELRGLRLGREFLEDFTDCAPTAVHGERGVGEEEKAQENRESPHQNAGPDADAFEPSERLEAVGERPADEKDREGGENAKDDGDE